MKRQEQVLFYQFQDDEKLALACKTLHKMGIVTKILQPEDWREKVGYLLGAKGFQPAKAKDEDNFVFPHEVMVLRISATSVWMKCCWRSKRQACPISALRRW